MTPLPETLAPSTPSKIFVILEAPGWSDWMSGPIPGQGGRQVRQTCEIMSAHVYHNEEER
jgi:hypothetical protein